LSEAVNPGVEFYPKWRFLVERELHLCGYECDRGRLKQLGHHAEVMAVFAGRVNSALELIVVDEDKEFEEEPRQK